MNEQKLIAKLKTLQAIKPGPDFSRNLKSVILTTPGRKTASLALSQNILFQSLNSGLAMALTAVFILIAISGVNGSLRNQLLTRALGVEILDFKGTLAKQIDSELAEAKSITSVSEKTSVALKEASTNGPAHINPLILEKEADNLNFKDPTNKDIDDLLDKAI